MSDVLSCVELTRSFTDGRQTLQILRGIDLAIKPGEQVAIMGASGSGKSTLLHLLGGLDRPTSGTVQITGQQARSL